MPELEVHTRLDDLLKLGEWTGRRQAFAMIAGTCSAADAESLRQVRAGKKYRALRLSWDEYCKSRLGIDRKTAESVIHKLEEFGPQYFTLAQLTGVTPAEYRRLASRVDAKGLLHAGEAIPITPENGPRLIEALQELRREAPAEADEGSGAPDLEQALEKGERALRAAVAEIERVRALPLSREQARRLEATVGRECERMGGFATIGLRRW